jgi:hypothetical protein
MGRVDQEPDQDQQPDQKLTEVVARFAFVGGASAASFYPPFSLIAADRNVAQPHL